MSQGVRVSRVHEETSHMRYNLFFSFVVCRVRGWRRGVVYWSVWFVFLSNSVFVLCIFKENVKVQHFVLLLLSYATDKELD